MAKWREEHKNDPKKPRVKKVKKGTQTEGDKFERKGDSIIMNS